MALTLYQEQIPFSNKKTDFPISSGNTYTNPVIMSFAFDFTICTNFLETVMYIKNDEIDKWYKNVVITLCKKDTSQGAMPIIAQAVIDEDLAFGTYVKIGSRPIVPVTFSTETYPTLPNGGLIVAGQYLSDAIPITDYIDPSTSVSVFTDESINARFSYGYDELSNVEWANMKPGLVIPQIGSTGQADNSYIPIRLRLIWKSTSSLFTIRDYFIDVSYQSEFII